MFEKFTRRVINFGIASSLGSVSLPSGARSNPAIVAALAVGASVVSIVSGIAGFFGSAHQQQQLEDIKGKLDTIIASQAQILAEIKSLRLYIDAAILTGFVDKTQNTMIAEKKTFDDLVVDQISQSNRDDYEDLHHRVEQTVNELSQYGVGAFFSFGCGLSLNLVLYKILGKGTKRIKALASDYIQVVAGWQDPANPNGIVQLIARTSAEAASRKATLNNSQRQFEIQRDAIYNDATNGRCWIITTLVVNGDFDRGFSSTVTKSGPVECVYLPHDNPCAHNGCELSANIITDKQLTVDPSLPQPSPTNSPYVQLNNLNIERNAIIDLMYVLGSQRQVAEQMTQLRKALLTVK